MTPEQRQVITNLILYYNGSDACGNVPRFVAHIALSALLKDYDRIKSEHEDGCGDESWYKDGIAALKISVAEKALIRWPNEMKFNSMIVETGAREFHDALNNLRRSLPPPALKTCAPTDEGFRFHYLTHSQSPGTIGEWIRGNGWKLPGVAGFVTTKHAAELGYEYLKPVLEGLPR